MLGWNSGLFIDAAEKNMPEAPQPSDEMAATLPRNELSACVSRPWPHHPARNRNARALHLHPTIHDMKLRYCKFSTRSLPGSAYPTHLGGHQAVGPEVETTRGRHRGGEVTLEGVSGGFQPSFGRPAAKPPAAGQLSFSAEWGGGTILFSHPIGGAAADARNPAFAALAARRGLGYLAHTSQ